MILLHFTAQPMMYAYTSVHFALFFVLELGKFEASETLPPLDHVVTMGKHTVLKCPKHSDAIPAIYSWGNIPRDARVDSWPQTNRMFYRRDGALIYASVEQADIDKINNYRGISCLMYNNGQYTQSRKYKFKNVGSKWNNFTNMKERSVRPSR